MGYTHTHTVTLHCYIHICSCPIYPNSSCPSVLAVLSCFRLTAIGFGVWEGVFRLFGAILRFFAEGFLPQGATY